MAIKAILPAQLIVAMNRVRRCGINAKLHPSWMEGIFLDQYTGAAGTVAATNGQILLACDIAKLQGQFKKEVDGTIASLEGEEAVILPTQELIKACKHRNAETVVIYEQEAVLNWKVLGPGGVFLKNGKITYIAETFPDNYRDFFHDEVENPASSIWLASKYLEKIAKIGKDISKISSLMRGMEIKLILPVSNHKAIRANFGHSGISAVLMPLNPDIQEGAA